MNIFGDFYDKAYNFKFSKKEAQVQKSEDWSAAILAGSSEKIQLEEPVKMSFFWVLSFVLFILAAILVSRLAYLQIITGQQHSLLASSNRIRTNEVPAPRGAMYDRNGVLLVRNDARFDLVVIPSQMPSNKDTRNKSYQVLGSILSLPAAEIQKRVEVKGLRNSQPVVIAENVTRDIALNTEEQAARLTGFSVEINPSREYLDGGSLAPFLGYTGRISQEEWQKHPQYRPIDNLGKTGLEQHYETDLRGEYGKEQVEVDATGTPVRYLAKQDPVPGNNLVLSIDKALQDQMAAQLKAGVERAGSKAGVAVAVDPRNGQVLAAVNYPSYDGNLFAKGISQDQYNSLLNDPSKPLFNRVASGGYPIGSTIKPFISTAALEEGVINASTTLNDSGKLDVHNQYDPSIVYTFKGWEPGGLGAVNVVRALTWSSDIFYYMVGGGFESFKGLGATKLTNWYKRFGFGLPTKTDIGDQAVGFVPTPEGKKKYSTDPWFVGDTYNISIGQGDIRITPLQLAMATAAVANGGTLYEPHFAMAVRNGTGDIVRTIDPVVQVAGVASPTALAIVRSGMEGAVSSGTACCKIKTEVPVQVAGKTGTAETSSQGFDGKNPITKPHAWFTSYAPANDPKIVTVVLVENSGEGAEHAVPITKEILKWYFSTPRP